MLCHLARKALEAWQVPCEGWVRAGHHTLQWPTSVPVSLYVFCLVAAVVPKVSDGVS